ncbi:hypothetical protein E2320_013386 [Naja naja]|nr:hypothetical protein E2320_013386 [Naja naja]
MWLFRSPRKKRSCQILARKFSQANRGARLWTNGCL